MWSSLVMWNHAWKASNVCSTHRTNILLSQTFCMLLRAQPWPPRQHYGGPTPPYTTSPGHLNISNNSPWHKGQSALLVFNWGGGHRLILAAHQYCVDEQHTGQLPIAEMGAKWCLGGVDTQQNTIMIAWNSMICARVVDCLRSRFYCAYYHQKVLTYWYYKGSTPSSPAK